MALCLALGGGAYAAVGGFVSSDGKIRGCVSKKGQLTVLKPPKTKCKRGLTAIAWNQVGQKGPAGLPGSTGQRGQTGSQGPRGFTGATGPSTGAAGGDLQGSYPNPTLKPNIVTGATLNESTVGQVPSAASAVNATTADSATTASDASALGGLAPDQYFPSSNVKRVEGDLFQNDPNTPPNSAIVLSMDGMSLVMDCQTQPGGALPQKIRFGIATTGANARVRWGFVTGAPGNSPQAGDAAASSTPTVLFERTVSNSGTGFETGVGNFIYRDDDQTITIPFWYTVIWAQSKCKVSGTATRATS